MAVLCSCRNHLCTTFLNWECCWQSPCNRKILGLGILIAPEHPKAWGDSHCIIFVSWDVLWIFCCSSARSCSSPRFVLPFSGARKWHNNSQNRLDLSMPFSFCRSAFLQGWNYVQHLHRKFLRSLQTTAVQLLDVELQCHIIIMPQCAAVLMNHKTRWLRRPWGVCGSKIRSPGGPLGPWPNRYSDEPPASMVRLVATLSRLRCTTRGKLELVNHDLCLGCYLCPWPWHEIHVWGPGQDCRVRSLYYLVVPYSEDSIVQDCTNASKTCLKVFSVKHHHRQYIRNTFPIQLESLEHWNLDQPFSMAPVKLSRLRLLLSPHQRPCAAMNTLRVRSWDHLSADIFGALHGNPIGNPIGNRWTWNDMDMFQVVSF